MFHRSRPESGVCLAERAGRFAVFALSIGLVWAVGCAGLKGASLYPRASVAGVEVEDIGLTALTLAFDVSVTNPYTVMLPVLGVDFALQSSGTEFLAGAVDVTESIPAGATRSLAVPVRVPYREIFTVLSGVQAGSRLPYQADLELHVDAPILGRIGLPLDASGEINIPRL